ncbi:MAG: DUF444 family protein [Proteobacteria bacterium]|jgi:hypothetical protein|nr:DUF444 family protein [Pseudomonadota bacterium]
MSIKEDLNRFRDIIRGKIKEDFRRFVSQGEMIGKRENEYVKIPLPQIEIPTFRYGPKNQGGVGQGEGKPGDSVGEAQPGQGQAGNTPGEHMLEVEFTVGELAQILGEKLALPNIKPKGQKNVETTKTKYSGLAPVGPQGLRHFKHSYKRALARQISSGTYNPGDPMVIPRREDMKFKSFKTVTKPMTKAVVIYMMDVSGSMGDEQKEIVRIESFWINAWLQKHYKGLETRFIIHDAAAKEVDESTFFKTSESGGTLISSAYKLCQEMIEKDYPPNEWNIYPFHFSDGDNWSGEDTRLCIRLLHEFFLSKCNAFFYGQVESKYGSGQFLKDLQKEFGNDDRVITSQIENKDKIMDSIKDFLGKGK